MRPGQASCGSSGVADCHQRACQAQGLVQYFAILWYHKCLLVLLVLHGSVGLVALGEALWAAALQARTVLELVRALYTDPQVGGPSPNLILIREQALSFS